MGAATAAVARARNQASVPTPPGRSVSFGAVTTSSSSTIGGELRPPAVPPKPEVAVASVVSTRRVQLSEPSGTPPPPLQAATQQDPDRFIDEASQMMAATSLSPPERPAAVDVGVTPGVIGAQEVYRWAQLRASYRAEYRGPFSGARGVG